MHQEIPHELGIIVKSIDESQSQGKSVWKITVDVLVNRPSQKPIVIGKAAQTVKYVRKLAEREVSEMFGVKSRIELWVRVEPGWMKNSRLLSDMGYMGELV
jgi:GTP-binding protein Era